MRGVILKKMHYFQQNVNNRHSPELFYLETISQTVCKNTRSVRGTDPTSEIIDPSGKKRKPQQLGCLFESDEKALRVNQN